MADLLRRPMPKRSWLVLGGMFYLGASLALPVWLDPSLPFISGALLAAIALGVLGWRDLSEQWHWMTYLLWGLVVVAWAFLAAVSAWDLGAVYFTTTFAVWLLVVVPGLASLLRDAENRNALMIGVALGVAVYAVVALARILSGEPVLDKGAGDELDKTILGLNRNAMNMRAVVVLPFLAVWVRHRPSSPARWLLLGSAVFAVFASGGRAGIVAMAIVLVLMAALQPGAGNRLRSLLLVVVIGLVTATSLAGTTGPLATGVNRLVDRVSGTEADRDEGRELLVKKAWAVASENPVFGVGFENFEGIDHPIDREGSRARVRETVSRGGAHNSYAQALAELGFPGALAVFGLLGWVFVLGLRASTRDPRIRVATVAFAGLLVTLLFDSALASSVLFLTMAASLGATWSKQGRSRDAPLATLPRLDRQVRTRG